MGDYQELDGIEGALSKHAEQVFTTLLKPHEQEAFPRLLSGLVHLGAGDSGEDLALRKDSHLHDLTHDSEGKEIPGAKRLIEVFSGEQGRLLTVYSGEDPKDQFVTISHEVLLRKWDRVRKWIGTNSDFLHRRERIEVLHQQYLDARKSDQEKKTHTADDYLLPPGLPLEEGLALTTTDHTLSKDLRNYITTSLAKDTKYKKRKSRSKKNFCLLSP